MKLQILVPHWQETYEEIKTLLDSIAIQQAVDFSEIGVVLSYDGPEAASLTDSDIFNDTPSLSLDYPFNIKKVVLPKHGGVSACRNAALDAAVADYVMFCDADDMFCHACGLHIIFNEIEIGFDTLTSCFIEETRHPETKKPVFINHDVDSTFVHGKVHRLGYLRDQDIRFDNSLTIHEDSYFNILAQNLTDNAKYCPTPFFLWKWRDASVCRHDPDYVLKTYTNMLDSNDALVKEFERRGERKKAIMYVCFMIFDAYYTMNKTEWLEKTNKCYRDAVEKRFFDYFKCHKHLWLDISETDRVIISNGVRSRSVLEGMPMETITIGEWLDHIANARFS